MKTAHIEVCGLSRLTRTLFLKRYIAVILNFGNGMFKLCEQRKLNSISFYYVIGVDERSQSAFKLNAKQVAATKQLHLKSSASGDESF